MDGQLFTACVSEFLELDRMRRDSYEDMGLWGAPSECYQDLGRSFCKAERELAEKWELRTGWVAKEAERRGISQKWFWSNGLLFLLLSDD